jgi:hypothetical protein
MAESTPYLLPNTQGRYVTVPVTNTSGEVYRIDGTRTIYADYVVENGNLVLDASTFASQEFRRNVAEGSQGYRQTIGNSIIQASGTTPQQIAAPNPAQQGGSTPVNPSPTGTTTSSSMLKYPLTMDDGQDRIKFVPLKIRKVNFSEGGQISIKRPTYEQAPGSSPIFIGIQGSIADANAVSWGSGELNEVQRFLVNKSLQFMDNPNNAIGDLQDELNKAFKSKGILSTATGLGQLYFAEQATGVGGLLSRTSGQVLNPNLELLFQNPTLRTFQFQFKMSPRNKGEADVVKTIIKSFKQYMSPKKGLDPALFLSAPNVFKIQYMKGTSDVHKSINLIKECALLNFSVDYTPNGSYMTFGDGQNGDSEASMVTYVLSMSFQEIEPIYDRDYIDGEGKDHPIGF